MTRFGAWDIACRSASNRPAALAISRSPTGDDDVAEVVRFDEWSVI